MRNSLILFALLAGSCSAQAIEGNWLGTLDAGAVRLRLAIHIVRGKNGELSAKLDSLDQGANGIPVQKTSFSANKLHLEIPMLHASYDGTLAGDEINGTFNQGASLPLALKRVDKIEARKRPQNPKPPFPYDSENVAYENHAAQVKLGGTLTLPRGPGPFPAALLITGSGPQDRDETLFGHKPFLVIADYLTRRGIAVLRVDDRGVGESTGSSTQTTLEDMAGDVIAGVEFLKTHQKINPRHIGVIGHSEGGIVGPLAASKSPDIAFVVMLAGTGVRGDQVLNLQAEMVMRAGGATDAAIAENRAIQKVLIDAMRAEKDEKDQKVILQKLRDAWTNYKTTHTTPPGLDQTMEAQFGQISSPELRSFLFHDPAKVLRKLTVPVLAMNGERDVQVLAAQNLPAIFAALKQGGDQDVTTMEVPGLNHLFQECKTGAPSEYADLEQTFSPDALQILGDWLVRKNAP